MLVLNGGAQVSQGEGNCQAINWIKRKEGKMLEGRIRTFNDSDFLKQMELAIQYGFPFMFENVDEYIDPVIDPILEKLTVSGPGGRKTVKLGDKDIEWVSSNILCLLSFPSLSRLYVATNMQLLLNFLQMSNSSFIYIKPNLWTHGTNLILFLNSLSNQQELKDIGSENSMGTNRNTY